MLALDHICYIATLYNPKFQHISRSQHLVHVFDHTKTSIFIPIIYKSVLCRIFILVSDYRKKPHQIKTWKENKIKNDGGKSVDGDKRVREEYRSLVPGSVGSCWNLLKAVKGRLIWVGAENITQLGMKPTVLLTLLYCPTALHACLLPAQLKPTFRISFLFFCSQI